VVVPFTQVKNEKLFEGFISINENDGNERLVD